MSIRKKICTQEEKGRAWASLDNFNVPVQVIPPTIRNPLIPDRDSDGRNPTGPGRFPDEPHGGFPRAATAFLPVAFNATGDDVLPLGLATAVFGNHMVVGEFL
jgi:hypothetical protein